MKGAIYMSLYDWNGDGKKDLTDDWIEYNIYKNCMEHRNENRNNSRKSSSNFSAKGFLIMFLVCCVIACFNELIAAIIFGVYLISILIS